VGPQEGTLPSPRMPFADANGLSLYYEEHGEGEPLLCIIGLAADHLSWAPRSPAPASR
jgi:3-oxoadipate enol-lactonase